MGFDNHDAVNPGMPLELCQPAPRKVHLTKEGIWRASAAAVILLIGFSWALLTLVGSFHRKQHYADLEQVGQRTIATIDRIDGSGVYYSFTCNGRAFAGRSPIPIRLRSQLQILGPLSVLYLPSNPRVNRPAGWEEAANQGLGIIVLPVLIAALGSSIL